MLRTPSDPVLPLAGGYADLGTATNELYMVYDPANMTAEPASLNVSLRFFRFEPQRLGSIEF